MSVANYPFLRSLGLLVDEEFMSAGVCGQIRAAMRAGLRNQGTVVRPDGQEVTDESARRVLCATISREMTALVADMLEGARARLEEHFDVSLRPNPVPEFLLYSEGGLYKPHSDDVTGSNRGRRVSVVMFLNSGSQSLPNGFSGGQLKFYGLIPEPPWDKCGFALEPQEGTLVAFRSDVIHEVTPVTCGQRFTIVAWYFAENESRDSDRLAHFSQPN